MRVLCDLLPSLSVMLSIDVTPESARMGFRRSGIGVPDWVSSRDPASPVPSPHVARRGVAGLADIELSATLHVAVCDGGSPLAGHSRAGLIRSGCAGFEPHGAEVVSRGHVHIRIQRRSQAPQ